MNIATSLRSMTSDQYLALRESAAHLARFMSDPLFVEFLAEMEKHVPEPQPGDPESAVWRAIGFREFPAKMRVLLDEIRRSQPSAIMSQPPLDPLAQDPSLPDHIGGDPAFEPIHPKAPRRTP